MCGITGVIEKLGQKVDRQKVKEVNRSISHRGPDSEGYFWGNNFSFGHRRLSIIGLGEEGHQPMHDEASSENVLIFNGEIYNYIELKKELIQSGFSFQTSTDTEIILKAYAHWGSSCVNHFNGMWAFALWDKKKNIIFCSRDRFGIKPFYYRNAKENFVFGSEIKQILRYLEDVVANKKVLIDYLVAGLEEHTDGTFFSEINKLAGGHNLIYDLNTHQFKIEKYYSIRFKNLQDRDEESSIKLYKEQLNKAVKLRLRSDVKVGSCLSGGLDSSSITAIASSLYQSETDKFNAIHAISRDKNTDESSFAESVAKHCQVKLNKIEPSINDFKQNLDEVIYTQEEPFGSPSIFMQYFVMKKAKEIDCKVLLDGQGGDETLLGYESYYPAYLKSLALKEKIKEFFNSSKNSKLSLLELLKYYLYFTNYKLRLRRIKKKNNFFKKEVLQKYESTVIEEQSINYANIEDLQVQEIVKTQLPHLLKYEDKNSMKNSIETRLPFIDFETLECALSLNNRFKINQGWTKYLLRKAVERLLPKSVVWRKNKLGFNAPEESWLGEIQSEMEESIKASKILKELIDLNKLNFTKLDKRAKWRLYNVSKWESLYNVSIK